MSVAGEVLKDKSQRNWRLATRFCASGDRENAFNRFYYSLLQAVKAEGLASGSYVEPANEHSMNIILAAKDELQRRLLLVMRTYREKCDYEFHTVDAMYLRGKLPEMKKMFACLHGLKEDGALV